MPEPDGMLAYGAAIANPDPNDPSWPLPSFDARDWAAAFCKLNPGIDEDIMLAWFANALMRGYDQARINQTPDPYEPYLLTQQQTRALLHRAMVIIDRLAGEGIFWDDLEDPMDLITDLMEAIGDDELHPNYIHDYLAPKR